jgi:hypothetical protein
MDGSVNFYRTWETYKHGFGNLEKEFWLGMFVSLHLLFYELNVKQWTTKCVISRICVLNNGPRSVPFHTSRSIV